MHGRTSSRSASTDAAFGHTQQELDALVGAKLVGYRPGAAAVAGTLEHFEPVQFPVRRGACYLAVLRLDDGASFGERFRHQAQLEPVQGGHRDRRAARQAGAVRPGAQGDRGRRQGRLFDPLKRECNRCVIEATRGTRKLDDCLGAVGIDHNDCP